MRRRRRRRLGPEGTLRESLRVACGDPRRIPSWAMKAMLRLAIERSYMPWADTAYLEAARSLLHLHTKNRRHLTDALGPVEAPTLVVHGAADRLVPLETSEELVKRRPDWSLAVVDGIGHLPMLEASGPFLGVVDEWFAGAGRPAATGARSARRRGHDVA
jgi:pimeloyl-ACP methyl ester carboxylesterase